MTGPIFEVVSGQILLSRRREFERLHCDVLLPMMREAGIEPFLLLVIELGVHGRFLDIYRYPSLVEYERRTDALLANAKIHDYYAQISQCIQGSISVEIGLPFPHAMDLAREHWPI